MLSRISIRACNIYPLVQRAIVEFIWLKRNARIEFSTKPLDSIYFSLLLYMFQFQVPLRTQRIAISAHLILFSYISFSSFLFIFLSNTFSWSAREEAEYYVTLK